MDLSKLKSIKTVTVKKINTNDKVRIKNISKHKAPHAIKCGVLYLHNQFYAEIGNNRYPLIMREEDYQQALYAYTSPSNKYWEWFTLRPYKYDVRTYKNLKEHLYLVAPHIKAYVNIVDDKAYLCMERMNNKCLSLIKRYKPSYYADRRCKEF